MRRDKGSKHPNRGRNLDEETDIRDWISVLEETLRTSAPEMDDADRQLSEDLEVALNALRRSLKSENNSNSA